jgi:hypothetical protein
MPDFDTGQVPVRTKNALCILTDDNMLHLSHIWCTQLEYVLQQQSVLLWTNQYKTSAKTLMTTFCNRLSELQQIPS